MANDPLISTGKTLTKEAFAIRDAPAISHPSTVGDKTTGCSLNPFSCLTMLFSSSNAKNKNHCTDTAPLLSENSPQEVLRLRLENYADQVALRIGDGEQKLLGSTIVNLSRAVRQAGRTQASGGLIGVADRLANLGVNFFELDECPVCLEDSYNTPNERWLALSCCKNLICDFHVQDWINKGHDDCTQCRKKGLQARTQALLS